jgi:2-polyprenyl-3-methyl-5-hydroxy-6-metoxy-1,4-benzoquinol methylase
MTESSPSGSSAPSTAIDDLVARLKSRVEERRASGEYPEGLETELEQHFNRIVFHRTKSNIDQLQADIDALDSHMQFTLEHVGVDSDMPGGELIHKALTKALSRTHNAITEQVQEFAEAVRRALITLAATVQDPTSHVHSDLVGHLDAVLERLNSYEQAPVGNDAALGDLRRRIEQLERAEQTRGFKPFFTNAAFEENFRDPEADLVAGKAYEDLASEITMGPVLDFGCGRGEFIELMHRRGAKDTWGIEIDPVLAASARENGLDVRAGDGIEILASQPDESLGAVVLLQVIEHLTIQQQLDVVALAYEKLKPSGRIIVETVNPQSLYNYAHAFFIDPTHTRPVHPAYLAFVFEQAGFSEVKWQWRNQPPQADVLELDGDDDNAYNRNVKRLNTLLFDAMDYALIVTK